MFLSTLFQGYVVGFVVGFALDLVIAIPEAWAAVWVGGAMAPIAMGLWGIAYLVMVPFAGVHRIQCSEKQLVRAIIQCGFEIEWHCHDFLLIRGKLMAGLWTFRITAERQADVVTLKGPRFFLRNLQRSVREGTNS